MKIQMVIEFDLARFHESPRQYDFSEAERHLIASFERLEPGSMVRLHVHGYYPFKEYLKFTMRPDIILQIIANDPDVAREWRQVFEPEEVLEY